MPPIGGQTGCKWGASLAVEALLPPALTLIITGKWVLAGGNIDDLKRELYIRRWRQAGVCCGRKRGCRYATTLAMQPCYAQ